MRSRNGLWHEAERIAEALVFASSDAGGGKTDLPASCQTMFRWAL
jgi:hypothetical protein